MPFIAIDQNSRIVAYSITPDIDLGPGETMEETTLDPLQFPAEMRFCKFSPSTKKITVDSQYRLQVLKTEKIEAVKKEAHERLSPDDWKIVRHLEEKEAGTGTSIIESEFSELVQERKNVRVASGIIEAEINSKTKKNDIDGIDVKKHSAWPAQG